MTASTAKPTRCNPTKTPNAGAARIALLPRLSFLLNTAGLQGFMLLLGAYNQAARAAALTGLRGRTQAAVWTGGAGRRGKRDAHQGVTPRIGRFCPVSAGLSGRATGDPIGPVDREGAEIKALLIVSPPAVIQRNRAEQIDGMIRLTGHQQGGINIAGIDHMSFWQ